MANQSNQVNVFIPCDMDMFSPQVAESVVQLLEKLGLVVHYNAEQTCCGRKFYFSGETECARDLATKMMSEFGESKYPLIIPSAACAGFIRKYYGSLLTNISVVNDLRNFVANTYELCDFIVNQLGVTKLNNRFAERVFYFKSCAARNMYGLEDEAEILLRNTDGLELLTDPDMTGCCSANGRFSVINPEMSDQMIEKIVTKIYSMGTQYITSTDIHCLQHFDAFIQAKGIGLEVIHIADILNAEGKN